MLCLVPVTRARWEELGELARQGCAAQVQTAAGVVPIEWRRMGKDIVGKSVAGLYVLLREPESCSVREVARCPRAEMTAAGSRAPFGRPSGCAWLKVCAAPLDGVDADEDTQELRDCDRSTVRVGPPMRCRASADVLISAGLEARPGDDVRAVYGVELQVQGQAFSAVESGGDVLVRDLWRGLVQFLHAGRWDDPVAVLDPFTRGGRFDVAFDTAFTAEDGAEWVQSGIYANGDHDGCFRRFSTRAKKSQSEETVRGEEDAAAAALERVPVSGRRALLGKATAGRTAYLGSAAYVLLCIYERSKKTDGDWEVLGPTLKRCGWDGVSEVVRAEFRASRKWLGDQVIANGDGSPMFPRTSRAPGQPAGLAADELTLSQLLSALPRIVGEFPSRFRHTDPAQDTDDGPRVRDRRSSAWWSNIEGGALHWASGSGDVGRVVSTRRHAAADRTVKQLRTGFVRLIGLRGGRNLSDVLPEFFDAWGAAEFEEQRSLLIAKVRARYAIPDPAREGAPVALAS